MKNMVNIYEYNTNFCTILISRLTVQNKWIIVTLIFAIAESMQLLMAKLISILRILFYFHYTDLIVSNNVLYIIFKYSMQICCSSVDTESM